MSRLFYSPASGIVYFHMFTPLLYDHKFDIDDIIGALCSTQPCYLNTRSGIFENDTAQPETTHLHRLEPLPASFITELTTHPKRSRLSEADNTALTTLLTTTLHAPALLPPYFEQGMLGGWLRERVKEVALEWLDMRNLIPPSMRHVKDVSMFSSLPTGTIKVSVQ